MKRDARIFVAGGETLPGRAVLDLLRDTGFTHVVGTGADEPNLLEPAALGAFFESTRPEYVFHCAGKSGGIGLNRARPVELMRDNLLVTANLLDISHRSGVTKLIYLASSCGYPKDAPQPMRVESLGTGPIELTSEAYATAKLAGWKLCNAYQREYGCRFITAFPANAFGPHDDFGPESGHVIPALIRRAYDARHTGKPELVVWGTGTPQREFIYSRDFASACLFLAEHYEGNEPINIGAGAALSIGQVAREIVDLVGFRGRLRFDSSRPDGAAIKILDSSPLVQLGWRPAVDFRTALSETYNWFLRHRAKEDAAHAHSTL